MSKSLSGIINNRKSLSGLNSMNVYDMEVEGKLSLPNFNDVNSTLNNLSNTTTDLSSIDENIIPDTDDSRSIGSTSKKFQYIHSTQIVGTQFMNNPTTNSLSINAQGILGFYKNLVPLVSNVNIGESSNKFNHLYVQDVSTSNVNNIDNAITTLQSDYINLSNDVVNNNSSIGLNASNISYLQDKTDYQEINSFDNLIFSIPNTQKAKFTYNGVDKFEVSNQVVLYAWLRTQAVLPTNDNQYDIGSSTNRFQDIFATNGTIQTSDEREKYYIQTLEQEKMIDFIKNIHPVRYKWKSEKEKEKKNRFHCGFIAQEIKKEMPFDFGGLIYDKEADTYGLRYNELIAPLVSVIQQLIKRIEALENPERS